LRDSRPYAIGRSPQVTDVLPPATSCPSYAYPTAIFTVLRWRSGTKEILSLYDSCGGRLWTVIDASTLGVRQTAPLTDMHKKPVTPFCSRWTSKHQTAPHRKNPKNHHGRAQSRVLPASFLSRVGSSHTKRFPRLEHHDPLAKSIQKNIHERFLLKGCRSDNDVFSRSPPSIDAAPSRASSQVSAAEPPPFLLLRSSTAVRSTALLFPTGYHGSQSCANGNETPSILTYYPTEKNFGSVATAAIGSGSIDRAFNRQRPETQDTDR
jgi:hypothetical protein